MVFLGLGKPKNNEEYIEAERKHDEEKRKRFLQEQAEAKKAEEATEPSTNPHDTTPKPKKSIKDRVSGTVHNLKVKVKARKLKRYKKHKEKLEAKEHENASVDIEAEDEVFGKDLSNEDRSKIRGEYNTYAAERKAVKAERRKKLKEGISKLSNGESGLAGMFSLDGGGEGSSGLNADNLDSMFAIKSAPLDANVADDKTQYGSKAVGADLNEMFAIKSAPLDAFVTNDKNEYGKKAGTVAQDNPFGLGDLGKNNPFGTPTVKDDYNPFDLNFLKEDKKSAKKGNTSDPFGIFGNKDLRQKKRNFERSFSLVWGEKPKGRKKVRGFKDPLGLV